jgi:hypothetical protein
VDVAIGYVDADAPELVSDSECTGFLETFPATILEAARSLITLPAATEWPGLERERCRAHKCGYEYRCHPGSPAV